MKSYEERREERREYEADVAYEVWRHGGNPDNVDIDRIEDNYYQGIDTDHAANIELNRQRPRREEQEGYPEDNMSEE